MKKVKQISVDILVDEHTDGCVLAEQIARDLESEGNIVLGSTFMDDLTEIYKRDYPDLISEFDGEEICPNCNHANSFTCCGTNRRITCEKCGEEILLCSICNREVDCSECLY